MEANDVASDILTWSAAVQAVSAGVTLILTTFLVIYNRKYIKIVVEQQNEAVTTELRSEARSRGVLSSTAERLWRALGDVPTDPELFDQYQRVNKSLPFSQADLDELIRESQGVDGVTAECGTEIFHLLTKVLSIWTSEFQRAETREFTIDRTVIRLRSANGVLVRLINHNMLRSSEITGRLPPRGSS